MGIGNLIYLERAYPDLIFSRRFDTASSEWIITVTMPDSKDFQKDKTYEFYWANGSMLPES